MISGAPAEFWDYGYIALLPSWFQAFLDLTPIGRMLPQRLNPQMTAETAERKDRRMQVEVNEPAVRISFLKYEMQHGSVASSLIESAACLFVLGEKPGEVWPTTQ
jgi:hypothetical protein